MKRILQYFRQQSLNPQLISIFFHPYYFIRRGLYLNIQKFAPRLKGKLMDFGCGQKPYQNLFSNASSYIGVDMEFTGHDHSTSKVDIFYDGKHIPFEENTFDSIFCSEVLEHVFNIDEILAELNRVLKEDGQLLLTVPFAWNEHEIPYDFGRYTSFGLTHLLKKHHFDIIEFEKSGHFSRVIFQLINLYSFENFMRLWPRAKWTYVFIMPLIALNNIIGLLLTSILPKDKTLYFNNVVLVKKVKKELNPEL
ncbi:methyltransferase domain-containing protein [Dyadobacter tibetensis]|uniref:methyltransferase domain-containing protein n=1 Tax=Dyadobacter tibetensis TaxID=1211851 RepID=UPI00046FAE0C|nr:class I SAM-dependent methyltransferase [Dyadobacter tibetensis]